MLTIVWVTLTPMAMRAEAPRPNIVFILANDLGYGDVHCLNPDRCKIDTPHLDKLAGQSTPKWSPD